MVNCVVPVLADNPLAYNLVLVSSYAGFPHRDHVWITTHQFSRFHKKKFSEMPCKLESTKYARLFEPNPTLA